MMKLFGYTFFEKVIAERPEQTTYDSPYHLASAAKPYNPDALVTRKGLNIYKEMFNDEQVKASLMLKINAVLSPGWRIEPASDDPEHVMHADFVKYCLCDGLNQFTPSTQASNFKRSLKQIMSALAFGFSVTEKCYRVFDRGPWAGKIGLRALKTRPPHSFQFHTDTGNNITELWQFQPTQTVKIMPEDLKYFIIYVHDADGTGFGNWYGTSDLRAAYRHSWAKENLIKYRNVFSERFGMGIVVAKYPRGLASSEQTELLKMIKNIQSSTAFQLPDEIKVEILESATRGQESFNASIEKCDIAIARSVLLPDKIGFSNSGTGAFAQSKTHFDVFKMVLQDCQGDIEEVCNEQIIADLINLNFMNADAYPRLKFNTMSEDDKLALCEAFEKAVNTGVILPTEEDEEHLRGQLNFPKRTDKSVPMPAKPAPTAVPPPDVEDDDQEDDDQKEFVARLRRKPTPYEDKINFQAMANDIDTDELQASLGISKVLVRIKHSLYAMLMRERIVEDKKSGEANKLSLDYLKDLRIEWQDALLNSFTLGKRHVFSEVKDAMPQRFAQAPAMSTLPPAKAMQYFVDKSMFITGTMRDDILKKSKALIFDGIKSGLTTADVIKNLEADVFSKYEVQQRTGSGDVGRVEDIPGRLATIVRTNVNDAYNQGRLAMLQEEPVKEMVPAYQYSAILDDRTTDICYSLDGKIYAADDPIWGQITPPNHFNCRSTIIPITIDEQYVLSDPPEQLPDKGFGG